MYGETPAVAFIRLDWDDATCRMMLPDYIDEWTVIIFIHFDLSRLPKNLKV